MFEGRVVRCCSACDAELTGKDAECPLCSAWVREREYKALVELLLPYARLYTGPQDAPDWKKELRSQERAIRRAEKALRGVKVKWDEASTRWVKK